MAPPMWPGRAGSKVERRVWARRAMRVGESGLKSPARGGSTPSISNSSCATTTWAGQDQSSQSGPPAPDTAVALQPQPRSAG